MPLPVDDPKVRRPDTTLAEQLLGWRPRVPWSEGLARTVEWFRQARVEDEWDAGDVAEELGARTA